MSNQIEKRQRLSMQEYFVRQVGQALENMSGAVSNDEAKRLTYNLVTAAQNSVEESKKGKRPFSWNQQNTHNFLTQVIMHVTAGLDASNDEVYAFPYGNEMSVQPSYRGYRKMIKEHAVGKKVVDMQCYAVRENEEFEVEYGPLDHKWYYKSKPFNDAAIVGYVTIIVHEDGTSRVMEHTLEDIRKRRFAGTSGNSPAWKNWEVEMSMAKAIKRHAKSVDIRLRQDVQDLMRKFEEAEEKPYQIEETKIDIASLESESEEIEESKNSHPDPENVAKRVDKIRTGNHEYGTITDKDGIDHQVVRWVDDEGEEVGEPAEEKENSEAIQADQNDESDFDESWLA